MHDDFWVKMSFEGISYWRKRSSVSNKFREVIPKYIVLESAYMAVIGGKMRCSGAQNLKSADFIKDCRISNFSDGVGRP